MIRMLIYLIISLFIFQFLIGQTFSQDDLAKIDPYLILYYQAKFGGSFDVRLNDSISVKNIPITAFENVFPSLMNGKENLGVILKLKEEFKVSKNLTNLKGLKIRSAFGKYAIAEIDVNNLSDIVKHGSIQYVDAGKPLKQQLYTSNSDAYTKAFSSHMKYGLKGADVIVGIIDTGLDFDHKDFLDSNEDTRVLYCWDQTVSGSGPPGSQWFYGKEYTQSDINNDLISNNDDDGHGTFVAGISSSTGRSNTAVNFKGVAPDADLIVVKMDFSNYANAIDALNYIDWRSYQLNKPWVANMSFGSFWGPKDDTSPFEQAILGVYNLANAKGAIMVNSAGNEGFSYSDPNWQTREDRKWHTFSNISGTTRGLDVNSGSLVDLAWIEFFSDNDYTITITAPST